MISIGLIRDIKQLENRVMLTPEGTKVLIRNGLKVYVEQGAGVDSGFANIEYERAGADMLPTMEKVMNKANLILQVHSPLPIQLELLSESHIFLSFSNLRQTGKRFHSLVETKATFLSGSLLQDHDGKYPLLMAMSEIAGKMAIHEGAKLLTIPAGGKGKLLDSINGIKKSTVTIVGAGKVGRTVAEQALKTDANVNLLSLRESKFEQYKQDLSDVNCRMFSEQALKDYLPETDLLVIAVFSLDKSYDVHITKEQINLMGRGSVIIDVSIDQIQVVEGSHPTNHDTPSYVLDDIVYYAVPNIASLVPATASRMLTKTMLPFLKVLTMNELKEALVQEPGIIPALNIYKGKVTNRGFADYFDYEFYNIFELLELNL